MNAPMEVVQRCPVCERDMTPPDMLMPMVSYGTEYWLTTNDQRRLVCADCTPLCAAPPAPIPVNEEGST